MHDAADDSTCTCTPCFILMTTMQQCERLACYCRVAACHGRVVSAAGQQHGAALLVAVRAPVQHHQNSRHRNRSVTCSRRWRYVAIAAIKLSLLCMLRTVVIATVLFCSRYADAFTRLDAHSCLQQRALVQSLHTLQRQPALSRPNRDVSTVCQHLLSCSYLVQHDVTKTVPHSVWHH